jgi:hypothetical protein
VYYCDLLLRQKHYETSILEAVILPSLLCVPITLIRLPTLTALAVADWPLWVYLVLLVVWIVTVLPSAALAVMVLPFTTVTVNEAHWPFAPGVPASI